MPQLYGRQGEAFLAHANAAGSQSRPAITVLASGGFVMTWNSSGGDGPDQSGAGVRAQIFDAAGARVGDEFSVNAVTHDNQTGAIVTALPGGGFVVAWYDYSGAADASYGGVKARIFDAAGAPAGDEFLVNVTTLGRQVPYAAATLEGGNFLVAWTDASDPAGETLRGQIFTASGERAGGEIALAASASSFNWGSVVALPGGGFALGHPRDSGQPTLQLFDASGAKVGGAVAINSDAAQRVGRVDLALAGDRIVATWQEDFDSDGDFEGIRMQLFDLAGAKVGPEQAVNSYWPGTQSNPQVVAMADGAFLIAWQSDTDGDPATYGFDIRAQMFHADGSRMGGEFSPGGDAPDNQVAPAIACLPSGEIVVAWGDYNGMPAPAGYYDVRVQILAPDASPTTDIALAGSEVSETAAAGSFVGRLSADGPLNANFTYTIVDDPTGGAFTVADGNLVVADSSLLDYETAPTVSLTIRVEDGRGGVVEEAFTLTVTDSEETVPGGSPEITVAAPGHGFPGAVQVTSLASGGWLVLYARDTLDGEGNVLFSELGGRKYDAAGNPDGEPLSLGGYVTGAAPAVAELASGDILISWVGAYSGRWDHYAGAFTPDPAEVNFTMIAASGEVHENALMPLGEGRPCVTGSAVVALDSGGFAVLWDEGNVKARIYDANGYPLGTFYVADGREEANFPGIERLNDGSFLVTWRGSDGTWQGQRFDGDFMPAGSVVPLLEEPAAAGVTFTAAAGGGFAMTWPEQTGVDTFRLQMQLFDAAFYPIGGPGPLLDEVDGRYGTSYALEALPDGGFVLTWQAASADGYQGGSQYASDVYGQLLDASGAPAGEVFLVDSETLDWQGHAAVAVLRSGDLLFGWNDGYGSDAAVRARILERAGAPPSPGEGTAGQDILDGEGADLVLRGYGGDDIYYVDSGDIVVEAGGEGYDRVFARGDYALIDGSEVEELAAADPGGTDPLALTGNGLDNRISGNAGDNRLDGRGGADAMAGGAGNDLYIVDDPLDTVSEAEGEGTDSVESSVSYVLPDEVERLTLTGTGAIDAAGNAGDNSLYGNSGNNRIDGGLGADRMSGGAGDDSYWVDDPGDRVLEARADGGLDTVYSSIDFTLAYQYIERLFLTGSARNATGNGLANVLVGNAQANVLNGMGGIDVMNGGAGDDTYIVDTIGESVIEAAGGGTDTVVSSVTFALSRSYEIENLILTGTARINAYGNHLDNRLEGNAGSNILNGSTGADTMIGRHGHDVYYVDDAGDVVIEAAGEGNDTVHASVSHTLAANVETLALTGSAANGTGNDLANRLYGNASDNILDGGAGADTMIGRGGNDTYIVDNVGDRVLETNAAEGTADRILASVSYGLGGIYVETLELTGTAAIDATGNGLANTLIGNAGDNRLYGKGGNDILWGGEGADAFWFDTALGAANVDAILDFSAADDTIFLSRSIFRSLAGGTLAESAFTAGTAAQDSDDRIVYDAVTGNLWYDADGSGAGAAVLFATVTAGTALTSADFYAV